MEVKMSKVFQSIEQGLKEAVEYTQGNKLGSKTYYPTQVDVKNIRSKANMTQEEFAASFGISLGTLKHWERGDRTPRGPALVLLNIINEAPQTVLEILRKKSVA